MAALGMSAACQLLHVFERSDADRAGLIGRLHGGGDGAWLAELLMDLEGEEGELARLQLAESLREQHRA